MESLPVRSLVLNRHPERPVIAVPERQRPHVLSSEGYTQDRQVNPNYSFLKGKPDGPRQRGALVLRKVFWGPY